MWRFEVPFENFDRICCVTGPCTTPHSLLSTMTEWLRPAASSFEALHGIGPKRLLHPKAVIAITFTVNNSERPLIRVARIWLVSGLLGGERLRDVAA